MNQLEANKHVSRYYKISVNFGLFYYYYNSRTFRFRKGISPYLVGVLYALLNLLTGLFWGFLGVSKKIPGITKYLQGNLHQPFRR